MFDPDDPTQPGSPRPEAPAGPPLSPPLPRSPLPAPAPVGGEPPRLGAYEILEEIGAGGMGRVYRARHAALGKEVALKVLLGGTDGDVARFVHEARAMAGLSHPHLVPVHDVGESGGRWFFTMDLATGGTFATIVADALRARRADPRRRGTVVPLERALALVEKVARAVAHAHEHGIVHRDLKPSNVLIRADGEPVVSDFGLARRLEAPRGLTQTGEVLGTIGYMAPEQAEGLPVDERADVYALGGILYELLCGEAPFRTTGSLARDLILAAIVEPIAPRRHVPAIPRDVETILLRALAREPERRYASARALADDIRRWRDGEPIVARRPSLAGRVFRLVRRRRTALLSAAAGALLAAVATAIAVAVLQDPPPPPPPPAPAKGGWEVVHESGFDDPAELERWRGVEGVWAIEDGELRAISGAPARIALGRFVDGDIRVEYTATLLPRAGPSGASAGDLSLCLVPADAIARDDGYFFGFGSNGNALSKIMRKDRRLAVVDRPEARAIPGRAHRVKVERLAGELRFEVDGRLLIAHRDIHPVGFGRGAQVVLYAWIGEARFDDVRVSRREPSPRAREAEFADWVFEKGDPVAAARLYAALAAAPDLADPERGSVRLRQGLAELAAATGDATLAEPERAARLARVREVFGAIVAGAPGAELAARAELGLAEVDIVAGDTASARRRVRAVAGSGAPFAREAARELLFRAQSLLAARGERERRIEVLDEALDLFRGEAAVEVEARSAKAYALSESGRTADAVAVLEQGLAAVAGHSFHAPRLLFEVAWRHLEDGAFDEARRALERAEAAAGADEGRRIEALVRRVEVELEAGRPADALRVVETAERISQGSAGQRVFTLACQRALAELELAPDAARRADVLARLDVLARTGAASTDPELQEFGALAALGAAADRVAAGEVEAARRGLVSTVTLASTAWTGADQDRTGAEVFLLAVLLDLHAGAPDPARDQLRRIAASAAPWPALRAVASTLARAYAPSAAEIAAVEAAALAGPDRALVALALGTDAAARFDGAAARARLDAAISTPGGRSWVRTVARRFLDTLE